MDIGSDAWMRNIRLMIQETEEILSVEGTVISQRASELQIEASKLARQRAFLREERRRARMEEEWLRQEKADFSFASNGIFIPVTCLPDPHEQRIRLNVGGQIFEASATILRRDPASLLAALCEDARQLKADGDGFIYVERDWWTFRHILKFLRDGLVPDDESLLSQLYREAGYWRIESLKRAIEEQLQLFRSAFEVDVSGTTKRKPREDKVWWSTLPNGSQKTKEDAPPAKGPEPIEADAKSDWWTGSHYKGHQYTEDTNVAKASRV